MHQWNYNKICMNENMQCSCVKIDEWKMIDGKALRMIANDCNA